ncbi:MAG: AraC family transcriptional regulator [Clostridium sp.]|nr:AraC family transcriptional regulator [Clostridium sp.]
MNNLYEYIDPIASPYDAFCCDNNGRYSPIPAHWHYYVELLYILEGKVRISIDNSVKLCSEGNVILFPPKCVHAIDVFDKAEHVRYYVVKFDPGNLPVWKTNDLNLRSSLQGISTDVYPCCFDGKQVEAMNLLPLFEEIVREYKERSYAFSMIVTANICKIMGKLIRCWQKDGYLLPAPGIHPSYEFSFDLIAEYIDSHYFEELTAEKLASMCNMSHSTFSMNFYRRYGKTCREYITATRINVAENMLLFSNYDVSFIAQEVGYSDCSYFIRCYKKLKGVTPKQARKARG